MGSIGHFNSLDSCSMEMKSLMFVLLGLPVAHGMGVNILRMEDRNYESEEVEMIETEMDEVDTAAGEIDEDAACKSCCDPPVVDTCGELTNKLDEIDFALAGIGCPDAEVGENMINVEDCMVVAEEAIPECMERMAGTEDVGDRTKMETCLQEVTGDLVHFDEVESGSTLQGCMCQGFLANRKTLEDASKLLCSNDRNAKSSFSVDDDVLLWWLLYQGYYKGSWQSRHFGFHPKFLNARKNQEIGMFNTVKASGRGGFQVGRFSGGNSDN